MKFNITVKRKFSINGKEYNSLEEMPDDIREKFKITMGKLTGSRHQAKPAVLQKRIVFKTALGRDETSAAPPTIDLTRPTSDIRRGPGTLGKVHTDHISHPTKFEPSFSARTLIVSVILGVLLYLLYYLWHVGP